MISFTIGMFIGVMGIASVWMGIMAGNHRYVQRVRNNRQYRVSQGDYQYRG